MRLSSICLAAPWLVVASLTPASAQPPAAEEPNSDAGLVGRPPSEVGDSRSLQRTLFRIPAVRHPFVFEWGASYGAVQAQLGGARLLSARPGAELLFRQDSVEYRYAFFGQPPTDTRLRDPARLRSGPEFPGGGGGTRLPDGRLFAVTVLLPGVALHGPMGKEIVAALEEVYGKIANRSDAFFDLDNLSTSVSVYLETYRRIPYLRRMTFVSKRLARERNEQLRGAVRIGTERRAIAAEPVWKFPDSAPSRTAGGRSATRIVVRARPERP